MRCSFPVYKRDKATGLEFVHSCGRCKACRKNKQKEWGFRAYAESLYYPNNCIFLSLTYDDEHIKFGKSGFPTLCKSDIIDFKKRLGYYIGPFRFMLSGEYGEHTNRPHYHMIVFGVNLDNPVFYSRFYSPRKKAWIARCKAWSFGEVCIADVSLQRCMYVAKYIVKRPTGKQAELYYKNYGIEPEFLLTSRRPGLGLQYLLDRFSLIKARGYLLIKGHKIRLPRYYEDKIYTDDAEKQEYHEKKMQQSALALKDFLKKVSIGDFKNKPAGAYFWYKKYLEQQDKNLERMERK